MGINFEGETKHNFNDLRIENKEIMHRVYKYGNVMIKRNMTNTYDGVSIFLGIMCYGLMCFILAPTITPMLDIVLPRNETRTKGLGFDLDYGVDMQIYWFWLWIHTSMAGVVVIFNIIAADIMFITLTNHICYLFATVR